MKFPSLSVVVPNYNHAHYLPRCLQAILRQSAQPTEIIVLDDASTDKSVEVIESISRQRPLIRLHRNERNLGVVANINRGIDLARGDYVFSAAADDEVMPGLFEKSLALLAAYPQAALSCTIGEYREVATGFQWHMGVAAVERPSYLSPAQMVAAERKGKFYIPPHSVIFKKSALLEAGKYIPELKYVCDWFAMYVAGYRHGICFVPEPLAVFHVQPNSYYQRTRRDKIANKQVIEQLLDQLSRPEYKDAAELIRQGGALYLLGWPVLKALLIQPNYRWFLTPVFLRKNLWHILKLEVKKLAPRFASEWYSHLAGYKVRA